MSQASLGVSVCLVTVVCLVLLALVVVLAQQEQLGGCRLAEAVAAQAASSRALLLSGRERQGGSLRASQMPGPDTDLGPGMVGCQDWDNQQHHQH